MNYPSVKTLQILTGDKAKAVLLRRILKADRDGLIDITEAEPEQFKGLLIWLGQCQNRPSLHEMKMSAANDILEGFGVEYASEVDMREGPPLEYVNQGDTYALTLCRFNYRYLVSSWGDIVERHPRIFDQA